jgi:hypothetical protein
MKPECQRVTLSYRSSTKIALVRLTSPTEVHSLRHIFSTSLLEEDESLMVCRPSGTRSWAAFPIISTVNPTQICPKYSIICRRRFSSFSCSQLSLSLCFMNGGNFFKVNLASAKPSGADDRLSCTYAARKYITVSYTF